MNTTDLGYTGVRQIQRESSGSAGNRVGVAAGEMIKDGKCI